MYKEAFLNELRKRLSGYPQEEVEERLSFYSEMIDDRIEDGMAEADAVAQIGTVEEISEQIIADIPLSRLVKEQVSGSRPRKTWKIVLLAVGSPLWGALLIAACAVILALYIALWAVVISLYAVFLALAASAVCCVPGAVLLLGRGNPEGAVCAIGAAAICAGLAIFMFFFCILVTKGVLKLTKKLLQKTKSLLRKRV